MNKKRISATDAAVKYLYAGDRSVYEVKNNLRRKEYAEDEIDEALNFLKEYGYVDDERYCMQFITIQNENGKGIRRIKEELRCKKRINSEIIDRALTNLTDEGYDFADESSKALEIAEKITEGKIITDKLIEKTARRLFYLGYGSSDIMKVMNFLRKKADVSGNE